MLVVNSKDKNCIDKNENSMRKITKIAFVAAFTAIAGYGIYENLKIDTMSNLALINVEALANDEGDCHYTNGYRVFTSSSGGAYNCCQIWVPNAPDTTQGLCR